MLRLCSQGFRCRRLRGTPFGSVAGEALGTQVVDEVPHPGQDPLHSLVVDGEKRLGDVTVSDHVTGRRRHFGR